MCRRTSIRVILALIPALAVALAAYAGARAQQAEGHARFLSAFTWMPPTSGATQWFGGFSGIEVLDRGRRIVVLSDRATLAYATLERNGGLITSARVTEGRALRTSVGKLLKGRVMDSEGLVHRPDGHLFISYEGVSRVALHQNGQDNAKVLPRPAAFRHLPFNKSFEALAMDSAGQLFTVPENAPDNDGNIPVWRWDGTGWSQPFSLPRRNGFMPVGADFGPDGRFYLLERRFLLIGFQSRLRRWDFTQTGPTAEVTLLQTSIGTHDNLEGVSVWRDTAGQLRATMISDDNFSSFQRTELVEYSLPD